MLYEKVPSQYAFLCKTSYVQKQLEWNIQVRHQTNQLYEHDTLQCIFCRARSVRLLISNIIWRSVICYARLLDQLVGLLFTRY